jgi:hypothetical protein
VCDFTEDGPIDVTLFDFIFEIPALPVYLPDFLYFEQ